MSDLYITMGRAFKVVAKFPDTEEGARAANAHMEANPGVGVIVTEDGLVKLAAVSDKGIRLDPLECAAVAAMPADLSSGTTGIRATPVPWLH